MSGLQLRLVARDSSDLPAIKVQVENMVQMLTKEMSVDIDSIHEIILADESHYGEAITSVCPGESFSFNSSAVGLGKTMIVDAEKGISSVVLRLEAFQAMLIELQRNQGHKSTKQAIGLLAHELGHVKDNATRKAMPPFSYRELTLDSLEKICGFQSHIIETEFAACFYSARCMPNSIFEQDRQWFFTEGKRCVDDVIAARARYDGTSASLQRIAVSCVKNFWFILTQFSKLAGTVKGSHGLISLNKFLWDDANPGVESTLNQFCTDIIEGWKQYPAIGPSFSAASYRAWSDLLSAHGFSHTKQDTSWSLSWS